MTRRPLGPVQLTLLRAIADQRIQHMKGALSHVKRTASGAAAESTIGALITQGLVHRGRGQVLTITSVGRAALPSFADVPMKPYTPPKVRRRPGSHDFARAPSRVGGQRHVWRAPI
jgi:hypothetical protein